MVLFMEKSARLVAYEALMQVCENEGYSNIVLDKTLNKYSLEKRDNALASILFYGVIERQITLDCYIKMFLKHPDFKLADSTLLILRIAVYQLTFLEKIPESAIVNEAVNMAKELKAPVSFINGVLREMVRNKDKLILPKGKDINSLSIIYSVPTGLIELWVDSYGMDTTLKILTSFYEKSRTYIRVNNTKTTVDDFIDKFSEIAAAEKITNLNYACKVIAGGNLIKTKEFEDGLFHIQDLSSQYLCEILDPEESDVIIDVCAAPGGKTFTLAEKMNNNGCVYSYDLYRGRVKLIRAGAYRLGLKNVKASMRDATDSKCEISNADKILCDVPCSGFGTIRRKPEIRYKSMETISELPNIQYDILCKSAMHLKQGGILVYSTCTLNPEENGKVADRFLRENSNFEPMKIDFNLPRAIDEPENQLTMMPFMCKTDGFFVAKFKKKM